MSARKRTGASAEAVQAWLVGAVADRTGLDPLRVEVERPIAEFGLGSRDLVTLAVGLSERIGRQLDPSLLYDHPTISSIAEALSGDGPAPTSGAGAPRVAGPADDIAIISMACRFPGGADDPEGLWRLLAAGEDAIRDVPAGRWNTQALYDPDPEATGKAYTLRGGFLTDIDRFDASFFGIAPREAAAMDPQQRLLLQTGWEAIERAGMAPRALSGSSTGVYLGLYDSGYGYLVSAGLGQLDGHVGTGAAASVASGRLAYALDLRGPAVTVDTACSSSLVALHLAARALAGRECDLALAGGVTLMVTPRGHVEFSRLRGLSPTGRCRPFSNDADGVVWAEGCGLVLLKRLADARRDGDRVLAVVKGSAINQDGRSQGLSAPSGPAQERVVRAALNTAGLQPHDVDYVEAHGTGTRLGDPIEGRALASVFGPGRAADRPLRVGSLKSNIGHAQAAAGIAGVIKTVLALRHELLPASLYAENPTEQIDWADGGLAVPGRARAWPRGERVRRAGVSAFGISGTNAHVVIEEAPEDLAPPAAPSRPDLGGEPPEVTLFPLSARGLPALRGQAGRLLDALTAEPGPPLSAVAATLAHHRTHFEQRAVVVARHRDELLSGLRGLASGRPEEALVVGVRETLPPGKLAFVFPGQGAQWAGMARDLLARSPLFADELDRCDAALRPYTAWSVAAVLRGDAQAPPLERVDVVQPVLFAVMVSLAAVWRARGVRPDAVVGHSQGEVAAACVAGALSLHDAAAVVALRSQALTGVVGTGAMAVVALPYEEVEARLAELGGKVSVAAVNSGRSTVVAGDVAPLETLLTGLEREQVFIRRLGVDYASHSAQVEPVREAILSELDGIVTCPAAVAWYSTVFGGPVGEELEADYWYRNLREPVRFAATVERMAADGYRCFVELSPHPSLITALRTVAEDTGHDLVAVGSLRRDEDGPGALDRAAAELHVHGREIDWSRLVADGPWAELPTYAWDPQRYWTEPGSSAGASGLLPRAGHPLLGVQLRSPDATRWTFRGEWSRATAEWLPDHAVFGQVVVSGTTLAELCRAALAVARPDGPVDVAGLLLLAPLTLPASGTVEVSVEVVAADPRAVPEVFVHSRPCGQESESSEWTLHATASAGEPATGAFGPPPVWPDAPEPCWGPEAYARLAEAGLAYGPAFQGVRSAVRTGDGELLARLSLPSRARDVADLYPVHPALLDAALHVAAAFDTSGRVLLPVAVGRCELPPGGAADLIASVRRTGGSGADVTLDVTLWDSDGLPAGRLEGVRLRAADPADLRGAAESARHLYEVAWTAVATEAEPDGTLSPGGGWALLGDPSDGQVAAALRSLDPAGAEVRRAATVDAVPDGADTLVRFWPASGSETDPATGAEELAAAGLTELRALLALPRGRAPSRVVWVTRGAVAADGGDTVPGLAQSALWGLARGARTEHPELGLRLVDLDGPGPWPALPAAVAESGEPELAVRGGRLLAPRLVRARAGDDLRPPADDCYELAYRPDAPRPVPLDDWSDLELRAVPRPDLPPGRVRIEVRAGAAPGSRGATSECAGVIAEVGAGVEGLSPGQRVIALADTALGSQAVADARLVAVIPEDLSFTVGASLPLTYATAHHALRGLVDVQPGERVRIAPDTGRRGAAAARLAEALGARPTQDATEPADVLLVAADAERHAEAAPGGRVVALGSSDAPSPVGSSGAGSARTGLSDDSLRERLGASLRAVVALIGSGRLHPPPPQVLPITAAREAARRGAVDRSPVVLELAGRGAVVPTDGTVLVTGGLGAVGGHIARWLAKSGVPRLLLTSRRGPDDPRHAEVTAELSALGAEVEVVACDVADGAALAEVLGRVGRELPLRGVVHCAGVLADGVLAEQTPERFAEVLRPKVAGAANLHRLTAGAPLDLFLLVSSAAGVVGNAGQGNYAAANVFLDQLAHHRRALGLPGVAVSFGAWSGAGLAAEHADLERMARAGFRALTPDQACELVELSLSRRAPHLVAWALDRSRLRDTFARDGGPAPLWRTLLPAPRAGRDGAEPADRLARLPEAERAERVLSLVREEASGVLGLRSPDAIRPDQPLRELGMDSLMAVELRNRIGARLGSRLAATVLFDHPTTARLADHLLDTVLASGDRAARRPATGAPRARSASDEPVAVVSMACRLPGGVADPEALWQLLADGRDAVGPFPADRWDVASLYDPDPEAPGKTYAREGGFLQGIDAFDAGFFEITPREAAAMDPQQRLLLETAWEALERAGIVPAALAGSTTGVYIGMFGSNYLAGSRLDQLDGHVGTGSALSVASGRLAYALGLHGPALTVDTACSSSLAAVHLAAQALRSGECDLALTGGVTLMVTPQTFVEFSRLRGLSPTGRCRSFSDDADGAVWAEGAGMVVLKRLGDARRDGDEVLAVLRGTAVNQDGRSQGLSAPNGPAQERVVRRALGLSGLAPADIDYVEAHGTGTTLGDPIEAGALSEVFGASRPQGRPLYLGSLKSNLGHLQAASGIAGLIKVVLALRHETLPRTLHAARPSRHVDWDSSGLRLLREPVAWPSGPRVRRAGVSAFGISGTNAHVVVEEAPPQAPVPPVSPRADEAPKRQLFVVSARSDAALRGQAARLAGHLAALPADGPAPALPNIAHTLARHRSHFERRAAVLAGDRAELLAGLDAVTRGEARTEARADVSLSRAGAAPGGKVAFVFPGHGGQWPGMGVELMAGSEAFREELSRCDEAIARHTGWSVLAVLRGQEDAPGLEGTDVLQPVLFAVNAALAAAWRSLGVVPDAVVGHSLGEIAAAYGAGALTLDDAAAVVTRRAHAVVPLAGAGGLLSVELPREEVERLLAPYPDRLFVAAVNSGTSTAVSGDLDALAELRRRLDEEGVPARRLSTAFASHSPLMAPLRGELLDALDGVRGTWAPTPLYSTVLAEPVAGDRLDADYWYANLREPVRFADTVRRMLADGYRCFVELSPHPSLGPAIESVAAEAGVDAVSVGSLRRDDGGRDGLLRRLGRLYGAGHTPDWSALFPAGRRADLPTYAFARERHWLSAAPALPPGPGTSPLLGTHVEASDEPDRHLFQTDIDLRDSRFGYLFDHRVAGEVWLPASAFLEMALAAAAALHNDGDRRRIRLAEVEFEAPLRLEAEAPVRLQLVLRPEENGVRSLTIASMEVNERRPTWVRHVSGHVTHAGAEPGAAREGLAALRDMCAEAVDLAGVHAGLAALGIDYGPAFRRLSEGRRSDAAALGRLAETPASGHLLHPAILDAAFQTAALPGDAPAGRAFVPAGVGRLTFTGPGTAPAWATCRLRAVDGDTVTLDLRLWDEREQPVLDIEGFRLAAPAALSPLDGALFETRWLPRPAAREVPAQGSWLILSDESGVGAALSGLLGPVPHVVARRGDTFAAEAPGRYRLDPLNPEHVARLLEEAFPEGPPERVVQLSALDAPAITPATDPAIEPNEAAARAARLCCLTTLHLVRALAERPRGRTPRLFLVVRGTQAAGDSTEVTHPQQALGWGFGLAVAQEYPELATTLIDLPADGGLDALWTELRHADDERLVALRGTGRLVPRLVRTRPDDAGRGGIRPDGTYLITGGLGGLGRVVAERLVGRGARRLALLTRGAPTPEAALWLEALRERGVTVCHARADVADREGLATALDGLRRALGPVTCVVHTAGVLDDATLPNLTNERVLRVLAPKVLGTVLLTELVPEAESLVLFSSAAGLLGSAGQSPYCAANAFLDAWAHHLAHADRPALSLDWGAWTGVGLVAESDTRAASVSRSGLDGFSPQEGGELFERLLPTARRQLAPLALDWEALALDPDAARSRPLLSGLVTTLVADPDAAPGADGLVDRVLGATTAQERTDRLEAYVRARVGEVAGLGATDTAPTTALKELGLDSLMIVRLRNAFTRELGVELPASAVFSAADIRGLARDLAAALIERDTATGPGAVHSGPPPADVPADVPTAELRPATRDVVRLLRSARQDTPSAAHAIGLAVRLTAPTTRRRLTHILTRLAGRHAALRTAILAGTGEGPLLRVERNPAGSLLRWTELGDSADAGAEDAEVEGRLRELLEPPFDLAAAPLWRFELLDRGSRGQILVFGAHHAVSDLQSLLLVAAEIDRELSGTPLGDTVSNRDIDLLLQAQEARQARPTDHPDDRADGAAADWREAFTGSARLDLTLARPRPSVRSFRAGSVTLAIPDRLMERVSSRASRLAITPAAFCLGTLTVLLARERERDRFVLAVPVDTRIHVDAYDAVGFFGVPVPIPAQAAPGEAIHDVLRRTDGRLDRVLTKGAMFSDALSALAAQGLHRANAPLVEVYFNYVRSSAARLDNLEVLPAGTGYSDLDLMVTMTPDAGRLRLDYNLDIMDEAGCTALGEGFLRLLAEAADDPAAPVRPAAPRPSLALAATFALGNLPLLCGTALNDTSSGDGGGVTVVEAPYHHVLASLRDPSGVFADSSTALGVVLLRAVDLERFGPVSDALLAELRTEYPAALRALSERTGTPLVVGFLPSSYGDDRLERWQREMAAELSDLPGVAVLRADDWTRHHAVEEWFDDHTDKLAHLPFTPSFQAAVALTLAEVVRAVRRTPPKVIAVDGDQTLWSGVAGEIGPDSVDLGGPRALLARRLLQWRAAGALLVLVSNNDEATVRAVLDRPDSLLRAEHFSVVSATWGRKAERLEAAARTLNLGLDSFVFLDDNPVEIAAMRSALPEVLSVTCPSAGELAPFLARLWPLVPAAATAEDSLRAEFYRQERARDVVRERAGFEEFLAQLGLEVDIRPLSGPDVQRAEQLVRRTNQFTLRARSGDGGDLERWRREGEVWTAAARDRFGDYGQIGLLAVRQEGDRLDVLAWMLSCRALGRGVEERLLGWLADRADALGCAKVCLTAERTPRNAPARRLLAALGGGEPDDTRLTLITTPERLRAFRSWQQ
ncbi:SDR family NAD(P)-dependent oxidoreductase [Streptomyces sp. ME19-01-6]|uniref:SDR family NAD(P)-dependent oxidoreductase n=1 Tax=Streptomyces sp. ME19-01-6 TaxID=3028686 RepID=UPI0029A3FF84|nr:SDR family NAD(P)-dependent oxidoreductase [Streptomyces sp. ME19-01-6]MDX3233339.1 SDR family NAD(P)-dependent oxidoreductase [Streptomyces sp. ME19-01-6]